MHADIRRVVRITYTNHKGNTSERSIIPMKIWYGHTEWHPIDQWMLDAWCLTKDAERTFAIDAITQWTVKV